MRHYKPIFFILLFSLIVFSTKGVFGDEIKIEGTEEIKSIKTFEVFLLYNPKVLEVAEVKESTLFSKSGHPTFWRLYKEELGEHIHVVDAILGHGLDVKASGTLKWV